MNDTVITEEWAVRWDDGGFEPFNHKRDAQSVARQDPHATLMSRQITCGPWTEVQS